MAPTQWTDNKTFQFFFGISLFSLLPFLIFFFFTIPLADDIFYHNYAQDKTTWEFLVDHYNTWTGRYFSNLMMAINPFTLTSNAHVYPMMMMGLFLVFVLSLFFLSRTLIKIWDQSLTQKSYGLTAFFITVILTALFFHKMPRTTDTFYWFAGTSSHLLPMCLLMVSAGLYLRGLTLTGGSMRPLSIVIVSLTSFIVSGSNETLAVQWLFTLLFTIAYQRIIFNRREKILYLPLAIALLGFAILYFAPGNSIRAKELRGGHDIFLLLVKPWGLVAETTVRYLSFALLLALVAVFPFLKNVHFNLSQKIRDNRSRWLLALFGLGIFVLTFVPSVWTMGGLPPRRVLNNTYLFFLLYVPFLIALWAPKFNFLDRWSQRLANQKIKWLFALTLLFLFNNFYAWKDLFYIPKFTESLNKRATIISSGQNTDLILPPLAYFPTTFFYEDITPLTDNYRNLVFAKFYNLNTVRLSKDY